MSTRTPKLAGIVGATAAAAFAAYAIGSQTNGSADAASGSSTKASAATVAAGYGPATAAGRARGAGRRGLDDLAGALGVSEDKLRDALSDLRPARDPGHADLAAAVAKALGVDTAKVTAAIDAIRKDRSGPRGRAGIASALAKALGIDAAKVRTALRDAIDSEHKARRDEQAAALATAIGGVSAADVASALDKLRPTRSARPGRGFGRGTRGDLAAALAKELGVDTAKVTAGLETLRKQREAEFTKQRAEFAKQLAAKLGIDEAKVTKALADSGPFGFGGGPGRGGPGGPGHDGRGHGWR